MDGPGGGGSSSMPNETTPTEPAVVQDAIAASNETTMDAKPNSAKSERSVRIQLEPQVVAPARRSSSDDNTEANEEVREENDEEEAEAEDAAFDAEVARDVDALMEERPTTSQSATSSAQRSSAYASQNAIDEAKEVSASLIEEHESKVTTLTAEFEKTMSTVLASDEPHFAELKAQYAALHSQVVQSLSTEKDLLQQCQHLEKRIASNAQKTQSKEVAQSAEQRQQLIALKKDIKKAWRLVESSNEKEAQAKEAAQQYKAEIASLQKVIDQSGGVNIGKEHSINGLIAQRDELMKERDAQLQQITQLRNEVADLMNQNRQLETVKMEEDAEITGLQEMIATKKSEADREARIKERLEREVKDAKHIIEQKTQEIRQRQDLLASTKDDIVQLEQDLREQRVAMDKASKDYENLTTKAQRVQAQYDEQIQATSTLLSENQNKSKELRYKQEEINKIHEDIRNVKRQKEGLVKRIKAIEDQKHQSEQDRDKLKNQTHFLEKEIEMNKKQADADKKALDDLARERDILTKNFTKASNATQKQMTMAKLTEHSKRNLEQEIAGYKDEATKQRKLIYQLEKEREKFISETGSLQAQCTSAQDEVKARQIEINELKRKVTECETRLKQQQNLYEAVRSDRNLYSKTLLEAQEEMGDNKRKLKGMNHQIEQLKEEISAKESALVKEHFDHVKVEKERESVKQELLALKQQYDVSQQYIQTQEAEERKMRHVIQEADAERLRQRKEYDAVIQERDVLGTQLIRRNDELALLYEKIKIQQSTLNKGEIQYRERLEDIRILKLEVKRLRREKALLERETRHVDGLKNEHYRLQRDLLRERTRVKVLEEELQNPLNIHRWRKLEGADPNTFDLIQKVQALQKRLISKTEEVVEKELLIKSKEKLYTELKAILARQPGPEIAEQLNVYQASLRDKNGQLKAMASELNMYQAQVNEYKMEMDRLNREMQDVKKRYYDQKRKQQQQQRNSSEYETTSALATAAGTSVTKVPALSTATAPMQRYGGGFVNTSAQKLSAIKTNSAL